jgi:hypothetical protein
LLGDFHSFQFLPQTAAGWLSLERLRAIVLPWRKHHDKATRRIDQQHIFCGMPAFDFDGSRRRGAGHLGCAPRLQRIALAGARNVRSVFRWIRLRIAGHSMFQDK